MIKEKLCSFKTCRMLKSVGFPQDDDYQYYDAIDESLCAHPDECVSEVKYAAPCQSQVMQWLRLNHNCNIAILMTEGEHNSAEFFYIFQRRCENDGYKLYHIAEECAKEEQYFPTYEAAVEAGIQAVCEVLLKKSYLQ